AMADDAFTMAAPPAQLNPLLARLQTKLTSHLTHEEADALPLLGQIMSPAELAAITKALRGGPRAHHRLGARRRQPRRPRPPPEPATRAHLPAPPGNLAATPHPHHPAVVSNTKVQPPTGCAGLLSPGQYPPRHDCRSRMSSRCGKPASTYRA